MESAVKQGTRDDSGRQARSAPVSRRSVSALIPATGDLPAGASRRGQFGPLPCLLCRARRTGVQSRRRPLQPGLLDRLAGVPACGCGFFSCSRPRRWAGRWRRFLRVSPSAMPALPNRPAGLIPICAPASCRRRSSRRFFDIWTSSPGSWLAVRTGICGRPPVEKLAATLAGERRCRARPAASCFPKRPAIWADLAPAHQRCRPPSRGMPHLRSATRSARPTAAAHPGKGPGSKPCFADVPAAVLVCFRLSRDRLLTRPPPAESSGRSSGRVWPDRLGDLSR